MRASTPEKDFIVLDYDGTIAEEGGEIAPSVFLGIEALKHAGVSTSVITARPFQRLTAVCGGIENLNRIVSSDHPLATERGGRIVHADRASNLSYSPLNTYELDAIADVEDQGNIGFVGFCPKELQGTSYIWSPDATRQQEMQSRFGNDAIVLPSRREALRNALDAAQPCLVTVKFEVPEPDRAVLNDELNITWERKTAAVVAQNVDKFSALQFLSEATGSPIQSVRYAGNDTSDLAVLKVPGLRERIFVGNNPVEGMAEPVNRIASPEDLGHYLVHLAGLESEVIGA